MHLGPERTDTGAAVSLQLEDAIGHRRNHLLEFLLPTLSRSHSQPADHRVFIHLLRHIPGKLLIVWDGLPAHRSRAVWDFVRQQRGRIWLEFLPAYAPELNPTEYIWGHLKQHEIANLCPKNLGELSLQAIRALKRMRRRPTLVIAFWQQAHLFPL